QYGSSLEEPIYGTFKPLPLIPWMGSEVENR
ncbi:MAG: hypothetical protein ACI9I0_001069, partial [Rhodoferax sp.]